MATIYLFFIFCHYFSIATRSFHTSSSLVLKVSILHSYTPVSVLQLQDRFLSWLLLDYIADPSLPTKSSSLLPFHELTCSISACGTSWQLFENDNFTSHLLVSYEWFPTREGEKSTPVTALKLEGQGSLSSVYSFLLMTWPMSLSLYLVV